MRKVSFLLGLIVVLLAFLWGYKGSGLIDGRKPSAATVPHVDKAPEPASIVDGGEIEAGEAEELADDEEVLDEELDEIDDDEVIDESDVDDDELEEAP